jgi:hypothetical protein
MALTTRQRNKLPDSAFAMPASRRYPVPTKAQAKAAGISPAQNARTHASALSYAARRDTAGSYPMIAKVVKGRGVITPGRNPGNGGRRK